MASSVASKQRKKSTKGRAHNSRTLALYGKDLPAVHLADLQYRSRLLRAGMSVLDIDGLIDSITWREQPGDPVMTGDLQLKRPDPDLQRVSINDGNVLQLQVLWFGTWREVWRMRLRNSKDGASKSGAWTFELADDSVVLQESTDTWHFTKSAKKGRPKGWLCHEIAAEVAKRYHLRLGKVAKGKHYITDLSGEYSPMQVLQKAYAIEKNATGRKFAIRWTNGALNILPLTRNPWLVVFGRQIEDAAVGREDRDDKFATSVTARASIKKGKRGHTKLVYNYTNDKAVQREGFVHKDIGGSDVRSRADLERKAKRYVAKHGFRKRTLTGLTHPLVPFVRRGDAIRASLPEYGFYGARGVAYVASYECTLSGGQGSMSVDVTFDDPWVANTQAERDRQTRAKKRAARGKG